MYFQLILLVSSICLATCEPYLSQWPKKITVNEKNQKDLGLAIGTVLKKDKRTGLYIPPPITDEFDPEARLELMFGNKNTARNYCKVGPNVEEGVRRFRKFALTAQWCRNSDGEDVCCGKTRCNCDLISLNCACLSKEAVKFFEKKVQQDYDNALRGIDTVSNAVGKVAPVIAAAGK